MTTYLSGPITGRPDLNRPAFSSAAAELRGLGYRVVSPHEFGLEGRSWAWCMVVCLWRLAGCHAVWLLPDWHLSRGARLEVAFAVLTGKSVYPPEVWRASGSTRLAS